MFRNMQLKLTLLTLYSADISWLTSVGCFECKIAVSATTGSTHAHPLWGGACGLACGLACGVASGCFLRYVGECTKCGFGCGRG